MLISVLAVINIVFGFFHFGNGGFFQIILNLIIILIVNTDRRKGLVQPKRLVPVLSNGRFFRTTKERPLAL